MFPFPEAKINIYFTSRPPDAWYRVSLTNNDEIAIGPDIQAYFDYRNNHVTQSKLRCIKLGQLL